MRIGILALQGDFALHERRVESFGVEAEQVRDTKGLDNLSGLIIPGGESTTLLKLMDADFRALVKNAAAGGLPVMGTCAGAILAAKEVFDPPQESLGILDIAVARNAYGRQVCSFMDNLVWTDYGRAACGDNNIPEKIEGVFIRAPRIVKVGPDARVLLRRGEEPVAVRNGNVLAATFHPELSDSGRIVHAAFLMMCKNYEKRLFG